MDVTTEELAARFRDMADEELLGRLEYELTPIAREVVVAELKARGIELPSKDDTAEGGDTLHDADGTESSQAPLVTVAQYWTATNAHLLRACLESCGIPAYVFDEGLSQAGLGLWVASGGMRIQVPADKYEEAREILAAYERGEMTPPEESESEPDTRR